MTSLPRFERNMPALLEDLYLGPSPDYRDDLLAAVGRTRQRPAWSFPERWLPMDIANRLAFAPRYPVRAIAIALLVLALIAAGLLTYIGTHQPLEPAVPFGPARNGLVVYAVDGDIYTADPITSLSKAILADADLARRPVFSPDGTHIAFLRRNVSETRDMFDLVVMNPDGTGVKTLSDVPFEQDYVFEWAPDSSYLVSTTVADRVMRYNLDGSPPSIVISDAHVWLGAFQPPNGDWIIYEPDNVGRSLGMVHPDGSDAHIIYTIPATEISDGCDYGTTRWSPDGSRIAFLRADPGAHDCSLYVMDANGGNARRITTEQSGIWFETDLRWSPDGKSIAFDRWVDTQGTGNFAIQPLGIVSADGGVVRSIGPTPVSDGAAFEFSPDGTSIIALPGTVLGWPNPTLKNAQATVIDVARNQWHKVPWSADSAPSWQRRPLD